MRTSRSARNSAPLLRNRLLVSPQWISSDPEDAITKRSTAKAAKKDPRLYAAAQGWVADVDVVPLSSQRGELFCTEPFTIADEDINALLQRGAITLDDRLQLQQRIPEHAWNAIASDARVPQSLRSKLHERATLRAQTQGQSQRDAAHQEQLTTPGGEAAGGRCTSGTEPPQHQTEKNIG